MSRLNRLCWVLLALLFLTGCSILPGPTEERNECWSSNVGSNTGAVVWECVGSEASRECAADETQCAKWKR